MGNNIAITIFLGGLMAFSVLAGQWPQFQNTPGNTGYAPGVYVNPATADTVLKFDLGGAILAAPIVMGDTVYAATEAGTLYAVNFRTGRVAWTFADTSGIVSTPAADGGKVYVAARSGKVYGLNRMTGARKWSFETDDTTALFKEIQAPLKIAGNRIYVGCFNNKLYCLDTAGNRQWDFRTAFYIKEGVAVKDSLVVLTSRDEMVYGLIDRGDTCRLAWKTDPVCYNGWGNVAMSRTAPCIVDTLFFLNFVENDGNFWTTAFSTDSGKAIKLFADYILNNTGFAVSGEGVVYCNGRYYATDSLGPNGHWWAPKTSGYSTYLTRAGEGAPVVIGNAAVNVSGFNPAGLYFYNPASRALLGSLPMSGYEISSSLAASDSVLFFGTYEGFLFGMGHRGPGTGTAVSGVVASGRPRVFPNPFNPGTSISFTLKAPGKADLRIFNSRGQEVFALKRICKAGKNEVRWNGTDNKNRPLPNGLYVARLQSSDDRHVFKITLLK